MAGTNKSRDTVRANVFGGGDAALTDVIHPETEGIFGVLSDKVWPLIMNWMEHAQDVANLISVFPVLAPLAEPQIADRVLALAYPILQKYLSSKAILNFRLISRRCDRAVAIHHLAKLTGFYVPMSPTPTVILSTVELVQKFTLDMVAHSKLPFPFLIRCDTSEQSQDVLPFWMEMAVLSAIFGHRITALVLDICISTAEVADADLVDKTVHQIIFCCLSKMPNLEYLDFHARNMSAQRAVTKIYYAGASKEPIPTFNKLTHLEFTTMSTDPEQNALVKNYPACFLRKHDLFLVNFTLNINGQQLHSLKELPVGPNLKNLRYNVSKGSSLPPEPNLLEGLHKCKLLPSAPSLQTLTINLDWHWRPVDFYHLLSWLNGRFATQTIDLLVISSSVANQKWDKEWMKLQYQRFFNPFSWSWRHTLQHLPTVHRLKVLTDYQESWFFMAPFRECLEELTVIYSDPVEVLARGFLRKMFGPCCDYCRGDVVATNKTSIFEYFPKLNTLHAKLKGPGKVHSVAKQDFEGLQAQIRRKEWKLFIRSSTKTALLIIFTLLAMISLLCNIKAG